MSRVERAQVKSARFASSRAAARWLWAAASLSVILSGCAGFGDCGRACAGDSEVTAQVHALLARSPALDAPNSISVQTERGVVYLRGLVSTPYQVAEAGSIAARAPGAKRVQNLLSIDNSR